MSQDYYLVKLSNSKIYAWIPYIKALTPTNKKFKWVIEFKGGQLTVNLPDLECLILYGSTDASIPVNFFYECEKHGVMVCFYTRNKNKRILLSHHNKHHTDVITNQILCRENQRKSYYIAKCLLKAKLKSQSWLYQHDLHNLNKVQAEGFNIKALRTLEAASAKHYWSKYYGSIDLDITRAADHPINTALNAGYFFLSSSIMRWLHLHGFSLFHGYLHESTSYDALVWDLIEPLRYIVDKSAHSIFHNNGSITVGELINAIKHSLESELVWVQATHQFSYRKNLVPGIVLALKSYLLGARHFVVPVASKRLGGRPAKTNWQLPGEVFQEQIKRNNITVHYE